MITEPLPTTGTAATPPAIIQCDNCKHWFGLGKDDKNGYCRRYPPAMSNAGFLNRTTTPHDWTCGEHAALEPGAKPAVKEKINPPQRGDRPKAK